MILILIYLYIYGCLFLILYLILNIIRLVSPIEFSRFLHIFSYFYCVIKYHNFEKLKVSIH